ncbi:MAG: hypothetical protein WD136_08430, partial [Cyanobium sp.]
APDSAYLQQLAALRSTPLTADTVQILREGFSRCLGKRLPQSVEHVLLIAAHPTKARPMKASKKPRQSRGT